MHMEEKRSREESNMSEIELKLSGKNDFFTQEAYKVLRTNLQFCGEDVRVVSVTSCNENEGKTTVCLNLGKALAELGKNVLVIDADMRKSVMAGRDTNAQDTVGLSEFLTGMSPISECIYKTEFEQLHILFAGKYPPNPVELLSGKRFSMLLSKSREIYDYIIIDTPPLGRVIDAAVVAPMCDGVILIIGSSKIRIQEAQDVVEQLKRTGAKILGVVKNNVKRSNKAYYYSYRYGKAYKYQK